MGAVIPVRHSENDTQRPTGSKLSVFCLTACDQFRRLESVLASAIPTRNFSSRPFSLRLELRNNSHPVRSLALRPVPPLKPFLRAAGMSSTANRNAIRSDARMKPFSSSSAQRVFLFLLAFRIINALTLRTFFQPDEYYQALEPAWQLAFGSNSGAWLTWVRPCTPYLAS